MSRPKHHPSSAARKEIPRKTDPENRSRSRLALWVGLFTIVAAAVVWAHGPALSAQAVSFDDNDYLTQNHLVQNPCWASAGQFLTEIRAPSTVPGYYQPLNMISLMLDVALGGRPGNLHPFHRTSLTLHVINTLLIVVLLYQLFGDPWIATMIGLLFGVHPMTVETIPWIGERKTLLAAFFALISLIAYVRYAQIKRELEIGPATPDGYAVARNWKYSYIVCIGCYALSLLSKPTSTLLPVVLLLLDFWPLRRLSRRTVVEKTPFFLIAGASAIITVISQRHLELSTYRPLSSGQILLLICHNLTFYLSHMIWPAHLSSFYSFPENISLSNTLLLTGVMVSIAMFVLLLFSLRWTRALLVGWLCYFILLAPTLLNKNYSPSVAWDKYAYLPSLGILMILAWLLKRLWTGNGVRRVTLGAIVLVAVVSETQATRRYLDSWQDTESLYQYMLRLAPDAGLLHNNYGIVLGRQGKTEEAIGHFQQALQSNSDYADAHNNLGIALASQGKIGDAIPHLRQTLQLNPGRADAHNNLGNMLAHEGQTEEAMSHYHQALQLKSDYVDAHINLGVLLQKRGQIEKAKMEYQEAARIDPSNTRARHLIQAMASQPM